MTRMNWIRIRTWEYVQRRIINYKGTTEYRKLSLLGHQGTKELRIEDKKSCWEILNKHQDILDSTSDRKLLYVSKT